MLSMRGGYLILGLVFGLVAGPAPAWAWPEKPPPEYGGCVCRRLTVYRKLIKDLPMYCRQIKQVYGCAYRPRSIIYIADDVSSEIRAAQPSPTLGISRPGDNLT
jgi:hypothetical protein